MPKKKEKRYIPNENEIEILFRNDHSCCMCQEGKKEIKRIQIHHINENRSDYNLDNLAVLCDICHNRLKDKLWMGRKFYEEEVKRYKKLWEETVAERIKNLAFSSKKIKEKITKEKIKEKFDETGKLSEREIEREKREITYTNGLAPEAFGVTTPVKLSPHKDLLLQEAKKITESKKETERLLPILEELKRTEEIGLDDMVVLSRICLSIGDSKFHVADYSIAEVFYKEALNYAKTAKESKIIEISLYELGAAVGMQERNKEALGY